MTRIIVGPFNRVEGDLEVTLQTDPERRYVTDAKVNATLFRGFEYMLQGRTPDDALVYAPRICGICSVSQSVSAAAALSQLYGIFPSHNGQKAINLMLANENAADLLTHFYLFFMPDFARPIYQNQPWFTQAEHRFKALQGQSPKQALIARSHWLKIMGILAGKWPHTLAIQPGGSSRSIEPAESVQLLLYVKQMRQFLETHFLGDRLENFLNLPDQQALTQWQQHPAVRQSDLGIFLHIAQQQNLAQLGQTQLPLMSYGNFPQAEGTRTFPAGLYQQDHIQSLNPNRIKEDISHARYEGQSTASPWQTNPPQPSLENPQAYSWCRAPRLQGNVIEVGALARQLIAKHPLITDLYQHTQSNVFTRVMARAIELITLVTLCEQWLMEGFEANAPYCHPHQAPQQNQAVGLVEAARGSLGHWITLDEKHNIHTYQVIAPTTWNFSPRDQHQQPGALEQALINAPIQPRETDPISVQHIVRSFDPCMVCTVH